MADANSSSKRIHTTIPSAPVKRRRRRRSKQLSLDAEIRRAARSIYESGMADAMKAAALVIVARKLDELKLVLVASGLSSEAVPLTTQGTTATQPAARPSPLPSPVVANPCVHCGRAGIYKSKPNQFNRVGSWYCRVHMALAGQIEAEDRMDRALQPAPVATPPPEGVPVQSPINGAVAPGASSLSEAMGLAEVVDEQP